MMKSFIALITATLCFGTGCISSLFEPLLFPESPKTESVQFAANLGKGWNLGNTLEACEKGSEEKMGPESEVYWGNPYTTKELMATVKQAGYSSVRIPVTWAPHLDENYIIDPAWLSRVGEVVDIVLECGMYAIINVQHDDAFWLITDKEHEEKAVMILSKLWSQIGDYFKDYDERLIFETMNEPRVTGVDTEWIGIPEHYEVVNKLNSAALEAMRNSGGNNKERFVMITTYAARHEKEPVSALTLPDDDKVLVSIHFYYGTAHQSEFLDCEKKLRLSDKIEIYKYFRSFYKAFIKKGYGVVLGEYGWTDRENLDNLAKKAEYFVNIGNSFGIPCLVWDNGSHFRIIDRSTNEVEFPMYVVA